MSQLQIVATSQIQIENAFLTPCLSKTQSLSRNPAQWDKESVYPQQQGIKTKKISHPWWLNNPVWPKQNKVVPFSLQALSRSTKCTRTSLGNSAFEKFKVMHVG